MFDPTNDENRQGEDFVVNMTERQEIEGRAAATALCEAMGDDAFEQFVRDMIEASEDSLRAKGSKAARYCLEWLDEVKQKEARGFE